MIGLNKGISRKNEENSQLRNDVSDLESRIDEFQTNWASQEAELGMFEISFRPQSSRRPSRPRAPCSESINLTKCNGDPHIEYLILVKLRNQIGDLEKMKVKEACMISIVKQLVESDLVERQKQAANHKQLFQMAKILDINIGWDSMMTSLSETGKRSLNP